MKRIRIISYALAGLFLVSLIAVIFSFSLTSVKKMSAQNIESRIEELQTQQDKLLETEKMFKEWNQIETIFQDFKNEYLIPYQDFPAFRRELQTLFSRNGLQASTFSYQPKDTLNNLVRLAISFKLTGAYRNLKKFIIDIENKKEMILFERIKLSKGDVDITARFNLEVYFVKTN